MIHTYFFGANTPEGFHSEYDTLQQDPRIKRLVILKGGSGCGKSTLMRRVAAKAEALDLLKEEILCSSDPDSLDGLVLPELGLALVDGTAPHVVEPKLCGCGANYLNLGVYYREEMLSAAAPALRAAKAANHACYGPAYGCLAAAAAVGQVIRTLAEPAKPDRLTGVALEHLLRDPLPAGKKPGFVRRCYLSGITPKGLLTLEPDCSRLWTLRDSCGVGGPMLRSLASRWQAAGEDLVLAMDPMDPELPAGVFVPGQGLGYLRLDPAFGGTPSLFCLDLDRALEAALPAEVHDRIIQLQRQRRQLLREAVHWLAQAKIHHDRLEELYRPAVDFDGVNEEAEELIDGMLEEVPNI